MAINTQAMRAPASRTKPQTQSESRPKDSEPKKDLASSLSPVMRAVIMVTIMAATLMEVLDTSIVNVALPDMMGNLGATLDQIGWVSTGYIISNVIILPLTGWLSDYFGRKMYLTYSVVVFTVASFFCGTSGSLGLLIFWRVVQGAGGAAFLSTSQATLLEIFPPKQRGFAQAMFAVGVIAAPTLGPTVGGFITDRYTWPWIFFINVPIGIFATVMTFLFVPNSAHAGQRRSVDIFGILFLAIGLGSLQTVLERGERDDWFAANYIVGLAVASVVSLLLFVWWELRPTNKNPAVNLRVVKDRNLAAGSLYAFAFGFLLYGAVFVLPQFLQNVQTHTAEQAGLLLMPGGLAAAAMMPFVGGLSNRVDTRYMIMVGAIFFFLSMKMFADRLTPTLSDSAMFWPMIIRGAAQGLQFVPLSLVALGTLPPNQLAEGSGFFNLFRQLGGSFGIAVLATIIDQRQHFHYSRLGENLDLFGPATQQRLTQIQSAMMAKGLDPTAAKTAAYQILNGTLQQQAIVFTYTDVFRFMEWLSIGCGLLIFIFRKPKKKNAGAAAAAH